MLIFHLKPKTQNSLRLPPNPLKGELANHNFQPKTQNSKPKTPVTEDSLTPYS